MPLVVVSAALLATWEPVDLVPEEGVEATVEATPTLSRSTSTTTTVITTTTTMVDTTTTTLVPDEVFSANLAERGVVEKIWMASVGRRWCRWVADVTGPDDPGWLLAATWLSDLIRVYDTTQEVMVEVVGIGMVAFCPDHPMVLEARR
ncbi:MAG: hypothetical protein F4Y75_02145 [Acidimicrobiia bacterium]|nr:hypothetical protein [bacterium]MXX64691.1 hypothetical protein [Acidimicrobiia bacterium]MXZ06307.1 hypothetical protein [Acidimicrobiia bacterium]MYD03688.1 hypothetical protein [Acidimicrobiia bacterium]MYF25769.1 hypothetical protein [Acidimicrobiia bacterium]